jgi:hypothetical protein
MGSVSNCAAGSGALTSVVTGVLWCTGVSNGVDTLTGLFVYKAICIIRHLGPSNVVNRGKRGTATTAVLSTSGVCL